MNADLQARIEEAIQLSSKSGIDVRDAGFGKMLAVSKNAQTLAAKSPQQALRRIQIGPDKYRYIPLDGVRLSKIGADSDDCGGCVEWYSVERPDGQSFAIAHVWHFDSDEGARSCDLSAIPEYLMIKQSKPKKEKVLVETA